MWTQTQRYELNVCADMELFLNNPSTPLIIENLKRPFIGGNFVGSELKVDDIKADLPKKDGKSD